MTDQVICNCYDASSLEAWAAGEGLSLTVLRAADNGRVFVRGLVFCPEATFERLRFRAPHRFRLSPMVDGCGDRAYCSNEELDLLLERVEEMTSAPAPEKMVLPRVGDIVRVDLPPLLQNIEAEVTRVSPNTGNVRVVIAGKFWSVSWRAISSKENYCTS